MSDNRQSNGRFGAGNRANPKGRPRKSGKLSDTILRELNAKVTVTENNRRRRVSKLAASTTQIANRGASGDLRAAKLAMDLAMRAEAEIETAPKAPPLTASDREIVDRFIARLRLTLIEEGNSNDDA